MIDSKPFVSFSLAHFSLFPDAKTILKLVFTLPWHVICCYCMYPSIDNIFMWHFFCIFSVFNYFPYGSDGKESASKEGDPGSIPGLGRPLGEGNGNPLQYPCLENPMDSGARQATVHEVTKSWTRLSMHVYHKHIIFN